MCAAELSEEDIAVVETFIVRMYSQECPNSGINKARHFLFARKACGFENLPPTKDALIQHVRRVIYQAGYVWRQFLVPMKCLPSPAQFGWKETIDGFQPYWKTLPKAMKAVDEVVRCECKVKCSGRCSCKKRGKPCTLSCKCGGSCYDK